MRNTDIDIAEESCVWKVIDTGDAQSNFDLEEQVLNAKKFGNAFTHLFFYHIHFTYTQK